MSSGLGKFNLTELSSNERSKPSYCLLFLPEVCKFSGSIAKCVRPHPIVDGNEDENDDEDGQLLDGGHSEHVHLDQLDREVDSVGRHPHADPGHD